MKAARKVLFEPTPVLQATREDDYLALPV